MRDRWGLVWREPLPCTTRQRLTNMHNRARRAVRNADLVLHFEGTTEPDESQLRAELERAWQTLVTLQDSLREMLALA